MTAPKHVVGLSGGKDSSCLALALMEREPRDYEFICTPTGNELPELFAHLERMEGLLGKPIKRLGIGKSLYELCDEIGMLPNFRARFCTRILKIEPTIEYMRALPQGSVLYVGLRADEPMREGIYGDEVKSAFPLREWGWGLQQVRDYLDHRGVPIPRRTDCAACYHQRIVEWRNLWRDDRALFDEAAAVEARHGHTFRSPGRDTWPVALHDLGAAFASGRPIRGDKPNCEERDMPTVQPVTDPLERALRLQLIHIETWVEQGQQAGVAPVVLRALRSIAADALRHSEVR